MVMACFTMLMMALMLMLSFNLTNAIHEKIRIQSQADAQAYTVALVEARTYNSMAYSNRAIAAALVAQTSLHAWLYIASQAVAIHTAFRNSFYIIAGIELCLCLCPCPKCQIPHCRDAFQAFRIARKHQQKAREVGNKIKGQESKFNDAVKGIADMIKAIHADQVLVVGNAVKEIASVSSEALKKQKESSAPASEYAVVADGLNINNFLCTLEGAPGAGSGSCNGVQSTTVSQRGQIMQSVANATRTNFTTKENTGQNIAGAMASIYMDFIPMSNYLRGLQNNEGVHGFFFDSQAGLGNSFTRNPATNRRLTTVGGGSQGFLGVQWRHGAGGWSINTSAYSNASSGRHTPGQAHQGNHGNFDVCDRQDCFVNFRASNSAANDFNQPSTYGAVKQDLRWTKNGQKPWEVNNSGTINVSLGSAGNINLNLRARSEGYAVAKGKAYFHQLDDWRVAPNAFDPFWRAKLHRFNDYAELATVAIGSGDPAIIAGAPVEGR
jgi:hypothetical protein